MTGLLVVALVSYLCGAIPFSYIAGKVFAGIDLREHGSGNLGASNTFRFLGAPVASLVLAGDVAKGFAPVFLATRIGADSGFADHWLRLTAVAGSIIGHMFSVFVGFKGGKGVATTAGAFLAYAPLALAGTFGSWLIVFAVRRIVAAASIVAAVVLPVTVIVFNLVGWTHYHWSVLAVSIAMSLVVLMKHRSNIRRLLAGSEPVLRRQERGPETGQK